MKIWINKTTSKTHHIIKLNSETHSGFEYVGEFDDAAFKEYLTTLDKSIDAEKNLKLIKYFGYLHLLIKVT